ncbi:MAG: 2Fe-2S iron-sulfur cluster-binding protein [Isosphaeraceae bacterium]
MNFQLDGREVEAAPGETIWQVARRSGIAIPHLCYSPEPGYRPDGNCRACMVEVEGERVLAASCIRKPTPGMRVTTHSTRADTARRLVFELLAGDQPPREKAHDPDSKFWTWAERLGVEGSRFPARLPVPPDRSHPAIAVQLDSCIHCGLCTRGCREVQVNDVIGMMGRGAHQRIVFDLADPMGSSSCVGCGECVQACPTGALLPTTLLDEAGQPAHEPDRRVESLCPYCGVGCQLTFHVERDRILFVEGRDGPANRGRLCVKGRYGFDYVHHRGRLTVPLILKGRSSKRADDAVDPSNPGRTSGRPPRDEASTGRGRLAGRSGTRAAKDFRWRASARRRARTRRPIFQKLERHRIRQQQRDYCTRLCHASSVAALMETIGSGAVSGLVLRVCQPT